MAELVVLGVAALLALLWREHLIAKERQAWIDERHMLLERIQRPERTPSPPTIRTPPTEEERRAARAQREALAQIGTVAPPRND